MKKYLKLLFVALFATMTVSLYSCKSDDDEPGNSNSELIGTWKDVTYESVGLLHYNQFKEDGTCIIVGIMTDINMKPDIEYTKWRREGNTLYIDGQITGKIDKLNSKELVVSAMGISTTFIKVPDSEIEKYLK